MDHGPLSMVADTFQWVCSEPLLNACGKEEKCCRRQRIIPPFRFGRALTATCASQPVETLADFHRAFHAVWGPTITYKAFSNQVATPHCADVARPMTSRLIGDMTLKGLGCAPGRAVSALRSILLQDGSSFALHDGWREVFPGRCKVVQPAAVALHTTMELLCDAPTTVVLTPDTANAQAFLPAPASLRGSFLLADRGSVDLHSMSRVQDAGGFFLIRAKAGMHPQVIEAFRDDGKRLRSLRNQALQTIHAPLPKRQRVDRVVRGQVDGPPLVLRLVGSWNPKPHRFCSLLTNLPATRSSLDMICRAYKGRWQGEFLFQEWKSSAHLQAFDTEKATRVEGLIWTAIAAAALKRFLAHMTPLLTAVPMSTRKVAMCAGHV